MTLLKILVFGFVLASLVLAYLLFASSLAWSMAGFDCADGYWACRRNVAGEMAMILIPAMIVWGALGWLLVREWKKD